MTVYTYTYLSDGTSKTVDLDTSTAQPVDEKLMAEEGMSQVTWVDTDLIVSDPVYFGRLRSEAPAGTLFVLQKYATIDFINIMRSIVQEGGDKSKMIQLTAIGPKVPVPPPTGAPVVGVDEGWLAWISRTSNTILEFFDVG